MQSSNDTTLVKALKEGDIHAFDKLYYRYSNMLFAFSLKYLKYRAEAEDLVQKVFIIIWERKSYLDENKNFKRYLFKIARNEIYDFLKLRITRSYYDDYLTAELSYPASDELERKRMIELVYDLVERLPERRAQIFRMNKEDGLTYKQIAEQLNISENTVDTQIRHSLNFLRKEMLRLRIIISFFI